MGRVGNLIDGHAQVLGKLFVAFGFEKVQIIGDDSCRQAVAQLQVLELNQQTFTQIPRRDTDRIEKVNAPEHRFDFLRAASRGGANLLRG